MSADTLVFDMAESAEGQPSVFVRKDWLSILDNQNQNYTGNQSVIDTSQLANSNKYMNYREAYLTVPLLLTLTNDSAAPTNAIDPTSAGGSCDYAVGLKNWFGQIVHSMTVDYQGTTIVQQTPFANLWNCFKLNTTLSYNDILNQGSTIGFYPDTAVSFSYSSANSATGIYTSPWGTVSNNDIQQAFTVVQGALNSYQQCNEGLLKRHQYWNFDLDAVTASTGNSAPFSTLITAQQVNQVWKSYIFNKVAGVATSKSMVWQAAITAQIYLRHLHPFFDAVPLLKGVFLKLTLNFNQSSVNFSTSGSATPGSQVFNTVTVNSPLGGTSPIMLSSINSGTKPLVTGGYIASIAVGAKILNSTQSALGAVNAPLSPSIILNIPAYTFNPTFESAYLSSPVKKIVYTDLYQYQIVNQIQAGGTFNNLITNGIADIKSVLVLPYYSKTNNAGLTPIQSPFDPASSTTSPLVLFNQFNVQISGQNAIYNTERYAYEQFLNQLHGQTGSLNGGLTDGESSGLIGQLEFETEYCYYYVNCGRMLPVEQSVPKSVNVLGTLSGSIPIDMYIFVEYGVSVAIDILTGARV